MPTYKPVSYEAPSFLEMHREAKKPKPEDLLPWRMFPEYGSFTCRRCRHQVGEVFILTKTRKMADELFRKNMGLSAGCMCQVLIQPSHRIRILDGGRPNPPVEAPLGCGKAG